MNKGKCEYRFYAVAFLLCFIGVVVVFCLKAGNLKKRNSELKETVTLLNDALSASNEETENLKETVASLNNALSATNEMREADIGRYRHSWAESLSYLDIDTDVVFIGDSITIHHNFQNDFPDVTCVNLGVAGDSVYNLSMRSDMITALSPETVFCMIGVNGLMQDSVEGNVVYYKSFIDKVKETLPECKIYIQSVLPVREDAALEGRAPNNTTIKEFNKQLKEMCNNTGGGYII